MNNNNGPQGPLHGIRVLELGQLIAGPYTGSFLGYFGAEVIKVEQPGCGDPLRTWRMMDGDTSVWWASIARNKKSITANLRTPEGSDIVRRLAAECDVLIENFRPGAMEKWGLGPDELRKDNPGLIYARVSGYGQDGPYSSRLGFASVCEGFGGFRYLNGFPDRPPVRPNLSMGDTLAALHTALGIVMACVHKLNDPEKHGQVIDVAIYEAVYSMLESVVPEYDRGGVVRECSGSTLTGIVPTNTYRCADGKDVIIGANGDSIFKRLCIAMGRPDMGEDPRFASNNDRVEHEPEIDALIEVWMKTMTGDEALKVLEEAQVPSGPIYSVADMMVDEQYNARGMFETVESNGKPLKVPAMIPKLSKTPGATRTTAPALGAHNEEVLGNLLGMSAEEIAKLKEAGAI
ncbi:MAG: CaiB/BaiF CoA-transferase family protein [Gammaproteobacteria bacterium]|jgi:crotonobetainyl-CoA:carnitine CoA-transferase CaiB-like acyl-CoA transferase|nr:CaiB/BaiF CoA-transferase family protein [Gammaproteobacteria bacterium]